MSDTGSEHPDTMRLVYDTLKPMVEGAGVLFAVTADHRGRLHEWYASRGQVPMVHSRACTSNFKISPIHRALRSIIGKTRPGRVVAHSWLGITKDEEERRIKADKIVEAGKSRAKWELSKYPLLDNLDHEWTRNDCRELLRSEALVVSKSGCFMCHYKGRKDAEILKEIHRPMFEAWRELEKNARERTRREDWPHSDSIWWWGSTENIVGQASLSDFGAELGPLALSRLEYTLDPDGPQCDAPTGGCFL